MVAKLPVEEILVLREESHAPLSMKKRKYVIVFDSKIADMLANLTIRYIPIMKVNAVSQVVDCTSSRSALRTARTHGFPLSETLPLRDLEASQQLRLVNFASHQLPKCRQLMGRLS